MGPAPAPLIDISWESQAAMVDVDDEEEFNPYGAPLAPLSDDGWLPKAPPPVSTSVAMKGCAIQAAGWLMMLFAVYFEKQARLSIPIGCVGFAMLTIPGFYFLYKRVSAFLNRWRAG